jgi:polyphosphate kinase
MARPDLKIVKNTYSPPELLDGAAAAEGASFFNRELSWLEFNRRVLEEAVDDSLPVLERLKFLSIFSTNLDEFFMIRVSGLKEQIEEDVSEPSVDGLTPEEQLAEIGRRVRPMLEQQVVYLHSNVIPELENAGITIEPYASLTPKETKRLDKYFRDELFPILTPQSVDSSHPFPYISNLSLNLGLFIEPDREATPERLRHLFRGKRFARIKLPPSVPRLVPIDSKSHRFALLEEVVSANAHHLFPNMRTGKGFLFRVTRDADIEIRVDEAGDLLRTLESELQRRRYRFPVRLEVAADMPDKMLKTLVGGIGVAPDDVYQIDGFVDIPDLLQLYSLPLPHLKERPISPVLPSALLEKGSFFTVLRKRDVMLHHPYISYTAVIDFVAAAAEDPDVQAIKICLYRTGKDSPVVESLMRAARLGKQVTAVVELKARFDEENNIEWARRLENEGVHVVYGISTLKTHCKVMLVVRREKGKLVRYVHIATGNYNPVTSRQYTDLGLLSADPDLAEDVASLFNFLTGYSQQSRYRRLLVAPLNLRDRFVELIRREREHATAGRPARIVAKINSLTDTALISELYEASRAGVEIDLIVRGVCMLRPGISGLSENIRVRSIVGRFLEHSRIFYFGNGSDENEEIYIGSSDWMLRNLDRRVEVAVPITAPDLKSYLRDTVLPAYIADNVNARELRSDGTYRTLSPGDEEPVDSQMYFVGKDIPA